MQYLPCENSNKHICRSTDILPDSGGYFKKLSIMEVLRVEVWDSSLIANISQGFAKCIEI